jgi:hypothetical protein
MRLVRQTETERANAFRLKLSYEMVLRCHVHLCPVELMDFDEGMRKQHLPSHSSIFHYQL